MSNWFLVILSGILMAPLTLVAFEEGQGPSISGQWVPWAPGVSERAMPTR